MKKILSIAALIVIMLPAYGQRYKYKELVLLLDSVSITSQITLLMEYTAEDPNQANASYRLAIAHYDLAKKADPLLEFHSAIAHAKEASLRLIRAKMMVTAQDVRSDNEYYAPYFKTVDSKGKPYVEFAVVQKKILDAIDSSQLIQTKLPPIYSAFTKSVNHYDQAVKLFAKINTEYKSFEDLLMLYDSKLDEQLTTLKSTYDSSLFYFNRYLDLKKDFPLKKYNQKAKINTVHVYRLDGFVNRLSFLKNDVEFWNYAQWVDHVRKIHDGEIADLKKKVEQNESKLNDALAAIEKGNQATFHKLDKDVIFKLNNYDKNSLALALMEYKMFKQDWVLRSKGIGTDSLVDIKLHLYSDLIQLNRKADSLFSRVRQDVNPVSLKKHSDFLSKFYSGDKGLEKFLLEEKQFIDRSFRNYQDTLKSSLMRVSNASVPTNKTMKVAALNIPLDTQPQPVLPLTAPSVVTLKQTKNPDGSQYLAGIHNMNKKQPTLIAFMAKVNADGKPGWFKEFIIPIDSAGPLDTDNFVPEIIATQEGCAALIRSVRSVDQRAINTFVYVTGDKGDVKSIRLSDTSVPRKLIYQESSNTFVMTFKGKSDVQQFETIEPISMVSINILGDLLWRRDIEIAGTLQDVITIKDGFLLAGNFTSLKDMRGKESRTKVNQSQSNPYLIKLSLRGDVVNILPIESPKSIYINRVVKVHDGSVNLLGVESKFSEAGNAAADPANILHMMTTSDLKMICSNF